MIVPVFASQDRPRVVAGCDNSFELSVRRLVKVNGQVLTGDTRQPVVGANVFLRCVSSAVNGVRATTDDQGRFSVRVAPGNRISQQVTGFGPDPETRVRYSPPVLHHISIPDTYTEFNLDPYLLPPTQLVHGRLQDRAGNPIGGVIVIHRGAANHNVMGQSLTQSDGRFVARIEHPVSHDRNSTNVKRYLWSTIDAEGIVDGGIKRETTRLRVLRDVPNEMLLQKQ